MKIKVFIFSALFLGVGIILYCWHLYRWEHTFHITFLNIGQGDSALINFSDGKKMLIDCGPNKKILSELGKNMPFYDRTIDYVLATHPDLDHYGGCLDVLKNYAVKHIITNGRKKEYDPYWREWNRQIELSGAITSTIQAPEKWVLASDTLEFFSPDNSLKLDVAANDSNNYSIVFRLAHATTTFLFTGDMESSLENALIEKYCSYPIVENTRDCALKADVLKVGHHGSGTGSSDAFVSVVRPKTAVLSVGKNKYGHPSLRVIRHLERVGADVLRTDEVGDIIIK